MSSDHPAISVRGLSKSYTIRHNAAAHGTLADLIVDRMRHPFRRATSEVFWALKDVSFEIGHGEVVGVIGRNGAGKSTLLKILSRITEPTTGEVDLYGRVGSLLEVGTGFHQDLTGRENIFLNGSILGMSRAEIRQQFDAIVDFAGVEKFLDTPVKRYSSGMYVRLAFAVAAHLRSEIMVVDEVLAVGDAEFQQKCLGKMKDVATSGRTVLFVSHNMQSISLLCNSAICLQRGELSFQGDVRRAIERYVESFATAESADVAPEHRRGSGEYRFRQVRPAKPMFQPDEPKVIQFLIEQRSKPLGSMFLQAFVVDAMGGVCAQCDSRLVDHRIADSEALEGVLKLENPWLKPGEYRVDMLLAAGGIVDLFEDACRLSVTPVLPYPQSAPPDSMSRCQVLSQFSWETHPRTREQAGSVESKWPARESSPQVGAAAERMKREPAPSGAETRAASGIHRMLRKPPAAYGLVGIAASRMIHRARARPRIGYLGGSRDNLGDNVMFSAAQRLFPDANLIRFAHPRNERRLARLRLAGDRFFESVLLGGGTLVNPNWLPSAQLALAQGLPIASIGTGVGSWGLGQSNTIDISEWLPLLRRFTHLGVRGPLSKQRLDLLGVENVQVVGDLALSFARSALAKPADPPVLAFNLLDLRDGTNGDLEKNSWRAGLMAALARIQREGWRIKPVAMHEADLLTTTTLLRRAGVSFEKPVVPRSAEEFFSAVAMCSASIGLRLHLSILSACAGVPPLILGYRDKHLDFAQSLQLEHWHLRIDECDAATLEDRVLELAAAAGGLRQPLLEKAQHWDGTIREFVRRIQSEQFERLASRSVVPAAVLEDAQ
jgi:lipopolysaccharide transport system ATP-binding protein